MYTKLLTALAFMAGAGASNALTTTYIGFDDGMVGGQVDSYFVDQGLRFSSRGASDATKNPTFTNEPKFKLDGMGVTDSSRTLKGRESFNIRVDFLNPIETVSASVTSSDDRSLSMRAYNEFDTLIGRANSLVAKLGVYETLTLEDSDIAYVVFETSLPYETSPVIDFLSFGAIVIPDPEPEPEPEPTVPPSSVPLPGSLSLMLGGLALLGGTLRLTKRSG